MLKAANQYVEVTTEKGTHHVRTTLKSLLEHVPDEQGIHVQRSTWIHISQIADFGYHKGNPQVVDVAGNTHSVSRKKVDEVKQKIAHLG